MAAFNALMDLFLPTNSVDTTPGNTTTSLRGISGRSYLIEPYKYNEGELIKFNQQTKIFS